MTSPSTLRSLGFLLGLLFVFHGLGTAAPFPVPAKTEQALSNTSLAESLELWNQLTRRINHLESENRAWEFRFNPEREESNWWNPFWRSSAERSLQRSNELVLQIRDLEKQRAALESAMLEQSTAYTHVRMDHLPLPDSPEEAFWIQLDAWRFPLWIKYFSDIKLTPLQLKALNPELQARRRLALEASLKTAKMLDHYLTWRQTHLRPNDQAFARSLLAWQASIQEWIHAMEPLLSRE